MARQHQAMFEEWLEESYEGSDARANGIALETLRDDGCAYQKFLAELALAEGAEFVPATEMVPGEYYFVPHPGGPIACLLLEPATLLRDDGHSVGSFLIGECPVPQFSHPEGFQRAPSPAPQAGAE